MKALKTRMENWKSDWNFMEQKEKDLYLQCEYELAAMQARIDTLESGIRRIINGEYDNARTIDAAEQFARELLKGDK